MKSIFNIKGLFIHVKWIMTIIFVMFEINSCKKAVDVSPPTTGLVSSTVYSTNETAAAVLTGLYANIMNGYDFAEGSTSITFCTGAGSDELIDYYKSADLLPLLQFYQNDLTSTQNYFWLQLYQNIYITNAAIAGVSSSTAITAPMKSQLIGEAKFMRAFLFFYATNLYGAVPLPTTTNYLTNNVLARTPQNGIYQQIIEDLKDAEGLLSDGYLTAGGSSTTERVRPNKGAAEALLARVYLYIGDWANAKTQAALVISNSAQYTLTALNGVFLANSSEAVWQLEPVYSGNDDVFDAQNFILNIFPPGIISIWPVALSSNLLNSFEPGDQRYTNWVGSYINSGTTYYYAWKYKAGYFGDPNHYPPYPEYLMVLRLAEQYLIRAEAEANNNDPSDAVADLNIIRNRAGLANYLGATDKASLLTAIYHEDQIEFFCEWGHRWFDLIRTGRINSVLGAPGNVCQEKGGTWNPNSALLPIPETEISINHNLTQNPGY
jgi:hypothetical protein